MRRDPIDRFVTKVDFSETCWHYTGHLNRDGYGRFTVDAEHAELAHRFAWTTFVGPIPEGMHIDHVRAAGCDSRDCVNPDHLEPVTQIENMRRVAEHRATCPNGHEYTPENTLTGRKDQSRCRTCLRKRSREAIRNKRIALGLPVHPEAWLENRRGGTVS